MSSAFPAHRPADNPFASHRIEALGFRRDGTSVEELAGLVPELGGQVAIVGPEGSGKTTLLYQLGGDLPGESVLVRIPGGSASPWRTARAQFPRPVQRHHAVLVDGAEQLGPVAWRRFLLATRPARFVVVTLHRPGRLPTLIDCRTDRELLHGLVSELVPAAAPPVDLDDLFQRHHGNIRLCFRELYDLFAGRPLERGPAAY